MQFIKKNPALAVGIGLPLAVVVIFSIAAILPSWLVAPPRYDALFATVSAYGAHDPGAGEVKYAVDNGHLKAYRRKLPVQRFELSDGQLFVFDAQRGGVRPLFVPPSSLKDLTDDWQEFPVPQAQGLALDASTTSPDGYEFHDRFEYNTELWPFFGGSGTRQGLSIGKHGREVKITLPSGTDLYARTNVHFLGWIVSGGAK